MMIELHDVLLAFGEVRMWRSVLAALASVLIIPAAAFAQCTSVPNTFTAGTPISAAAVNANFNYIVNCFATFATKGANTFTGAQTLPGDPTSALQAATKQYVDAGSGGGGGGASRRQTVTAGPVTTGGLPSFLPTTSGSLSLTSTNISSTAPLAATAANNVSSTSGAAQDVTGVSTSNLTWSSLTGSTTNYLYVTILAGALTTGSTTLAPIYQLGGTPATTNGQFTFNVGEMRGYLGNGTSAPQTSAVFIGEAVTNSSSVISTVAYAYNGVYDGTFTATLPGASTAVSNTHNLGVKPRIAKFVIENTTSEQGFSVGDQVTEGFLSAYGSIYTTLPIYSNQYTVGATTGSNTGLYIISRSSPGTGTTLTPADWKYKFFVTRGW